MHDMLLVVDVGSEVPLDNRYYAEYVESCFMMCIRFLKGEEVTWDALWS